MTNFNQLARSLNVPVLEAYNTKLVTDDPLQIKSRLTAVLNLTHPTLKPTVIDLGLDRAEQEAQKGNGKREKEAKAARKKEKMASTGEEGAEEEKPEEEKETEEERQRNDRNEKIRGVSWLASVTFEKPVKGAPGVKLVYEVSFNFRPFNHGFEPKVTNANAGLFLDVYSRSIPLSELPELDWLDQAWLLWLPRFDSLDSLLNAVKEDIIFHRDKFYEFYAGDIPVSTWVATIQNNLKTITSFFPWGLKVIPVKAWRTVWPRLGEEGYVSLIDDELKRYAKLVPTELKKPAKS
jgi:hypothetical protein